jgi:hypothetical protein
MAYEFSSIVVLDGGIGMDDEETALFWRAGGVAPAIRRDQLGTLDFIAVEPAVTTRSFEAHSVVVGGCQNSVKI